MELLAYTCYCFCCHSKMLYDLFNDFEKTKTSVDSVK